MKKVCVFFTGLLLVLGMAASGAETFRVRSMTVVSLDGQKGEAQTVELGFNDAIGVLFPKNAPFLKGVEIEIKIPQTILAYPNSMAYGVYRSIVPGPSAKIIDYSGEQLSLQPLPSRLSFVLQIPLQKNHGLKTGPYSTVLQYVHDTGRGPLVFRLQPIMKGLPENIEALTFSVKIKPILTEEGGFTLKLSYPGDSPKPVSVRVDEVLIPNPEQMTLLSPGTHHLSIVSDDFRNEVRMFTVEAARVTDIALQMQGTAPHLRLIAPENARIYLNGEQILNWDTQEITAGDHSVRFVIGDYELTKQITIEKGKDYTVSMIIDINVSETP